MRVLLKISMPAGKGNAAIADGALPKTLEHALETLKPEAAYFGPLDGKRTALFFIDLADPAQIPVISEPFFMGIEAEIEMTPMMSADDLRKGLGALSQSGPSA